MTPQLGLDQFKPDPTEDLTPAERDVWEAVVNGDHGVREYARESNRAPGTVGNLLRRARKKMDGAEAPGGEHA